MACPIT